MKEAKLYLPGRYFIGPGVLERGLKETKRLGNRTVVITGRKWAIESGTFDLVKKTLKAMGTEVHLLSGISPNPDASEIDDKAQSVRKIDPDFITGLGGGSVLDATKAISLVTRSGGKVWDYVVRKLSPGGAYPVVAISTVAASGSDFDGAAVINNRALRAKMPISHPDLVPVISIVDIKLHVPVPKYTTAIGCVDIFCQFFEPYITGEEEFFASKNLALASMKRVMDVCPLVLENPNSLEYRGELAYLASLSMSGFFRVGRGGGFSMHWLEHVLSGHFPEIPHAQGLASLIVAYTRFFSNSPGVRSVSEFLTGNPNQLPSHIDQWLSRIGVRKRLRDLGVGKEKLPELAKDVVKYYGWLDGRVPAPHPMTEEDVLEIYRMSW